MKVLLIEDDEFDVKAIKRWFPQHEYTVASTYATALACLNAAGFDLVLCDINIPPISDDKLLKVAQKLSDCPVIGMSGLPNFDNVISKDRASFGLYLGQGAVLQ